MKLVRFLLLLIGIGITLAIGFGYGRWYSTKPAANKNARKILYYVDAMHPWYKSDKPGLAPDCGMKLEAVYADGAPAPANAADGKDLYYRDPKDPAYKSDKPGMNPATGDDLEPVYPDTPAPDSILDRKSAV